MDLSLSPATLEMLSRLDQRSLIRCLYAASDLALRASRGQIVAPPPQMTPDQLIRQLITEMPPESAPQAG